jgi:hypothetical protein
MTLLRHPVATGSAGAVGNDLATSPASVGSVKQLPSSVDKRALTIYR